MRFDWRDAGFLFVVVLVTSGAFLARGVADNRPAALDRSASGVLQVTSPNDAGPGTLRDAIFRAARMPGRARIVLHVPEVRITTPLPPLVNDRGVVLSGGPVETTIDAGALEAESVLTVRAPYSTLSDFTIRGARNVAVEVYVPGIRLQNLRIDACDVGIDVAIGALGFALADSTLSDNRIGLRLASAEEGVAIHSVRFSGHTEAAVRATRPDAGVAVTGPKITLDSSVFEKDEISLLLANISILVEKNEIIGARSAGIYVAGTGAVIRDNRIHGGQSIGVIAAQSNGTQITGNEIDHNEGSGILLKSSTGTSIEGNRLHANGTGVISVFGDASRYNVIADNDVLGQREDGVLIVGGSPLLRDNRLTGNSSAGLRVLHYVDPEGRVRRADPRLEETVIEGNGIDQPVRGYYREPVRKASL